MSDSKRARLKEWLESGEARLQPLAFPQRELWEASPVPAADLSNHICCVIHVQGLISPQDCEAAIARVVERQEALRISFLPGKSGPVQMIRKNGEVNFRVRDLSSAEGQPDAIEELAREVFDEPFDLVQGPLYRVAMLRRAPDDFVLAFAIHHAVADGWTLGVFVQDLCAAHIQTRMGVCAPLPPVPLSYSAWGVAEREFWKPAALEQRGIFWKTTLSGTRRIWRAREQATPVSGAAKRWVSQIPSGLGIAVRDIARRSGATLFSTLLAAFQVTVSRWTGVGDVLVGTPVANRATQAVRETMGYCSGIVPLRGQIDPARPFSDAVRAAYDTTVEAFGNAMPFAELARALGDAAAPGYNSVFEVRFALQNHPIPDVTVPGLSARLRMRSSGTARYDLACEITEEGDAMAVAWMFRPAMFPQKEIQELDRLFQSFLAGACRSPENQIAVLFDSNIFSP